MPYQTSRGAFERARRLGHVPITQSKFVQQRLQDFSILANEPAQPIPQELQLSANELLSTTRSPRWALAFDGSNTELAEREEYPSALLGYVQIAGVLIDLVTMLAQSNQTFVDPRVIHNSERASLFSSVLPSSNIRTRGRASVRESWRTEIYKLFNEYQVETQSLLTILFHILSGDSPVTPRSVIRVSRCANETCSERDIPVGFNGGPCPGCGKQVYPTDVLRIYEEVQELAENGTALSRLMSVLEHLTLIGYLDFFIARRPQVISNVAFLLDGPLALFGPTAPLKRSMEAYLYKLGQELQRRGYALPIILGIQKTGPFAEHASSVAASLPARTLVRLPRDYIYSRILQPRPGTTEHGIDEYYGQKFIYKTAQGQTVTLTVPGFTEHFQQLPEPDNPINYPTLPDALALLDRIGTKLYQNALIPVALAHSYASIPLAIGSRVLKLMGQELLGQNGA